MALSLISRLAGKKASSDFWREPERSAQTKTFSCRPTTRWMISSSPDWASVCRSRSRRSSPGSKGLIAAELDSVPRVDAFPFPGEDVFQFQPGVELDPASSEVVQSPFAPSSTTFSMAREIRSSGLFHSPRVSVGILKTDPVVQDQGKRVRPRRTT